MGNKAFTLIELLVSVAIIGIIASIATANFIEYKEKAYFSVSIQQARDLFTSVSSGDAALDCTVGSGLAASYYSYSTGLDPISIACSGVDVPINSTNINKYLPGYKKHPMVSSLGFYAQATGVQTSAIHCKAKLLSAGLNFREGVQSSNGVIIKNAATASACPS